MSNLSYCRFRNTVSALADCTHHMQDDLSKDEAEARTRLIEICRQIVENESGDDQEESQG